MTGLNVLFAVCAANLLLQVATFALLAQHVIGGG